jgi:putative addiction module component (TIGR02574 family)
MAVTDNILREILTLTPLERARLIEKLIASLDEPDKEIDELWAKEAEERINAYDLGRIKAFSLDEILRRHRRSDTSALRSIEK